MGGDDDYEGPRRKLSLFDRQLRPLSVEQRDFSFELFETAVAAASAWAQAKGLSLLVGDAP